MARIDRAARCVKDEVGNWIDPAVVTVSLTDPQGGCGGTTAFDWLVDIVDLNAMMMTLNERPIRNSLLRLTLAAVFLAGAASGNLHGQPDNKAENKAGHDAAPPIVGTFAADGVKMVIESVNYQPSGSLISINSSRARPRSL